jgi:hypothetical protein
MRELGVRQSQQLGDVHIRHIDGKRNTADLFTKEIKDASHFQKMAFTITTLRRIADMLPPITPNVVAMKGGVGTSETSESWIESLTTSRLPGLVAQALTHIKRMPTSLLGTRAM